MNQERGDAGTIRRNCRGGNWARQFGRYSGRLELVGQNVQKDVREIEGTEDKASLAQTVHVPKP